MINSFRDDYRFLSNFWIEPDGTCVEKEYQAAKTNDPSEKRSIMDAKSPGRAKRKGSEVAVVENWDRIKLGIMYHLVEDKFDDMSLQAKLIATGEEVLIEGNTWGDTFWGVCDGVGENWLGRILMLVRSSCLADSGGA